MGDGRSTARTSLCGSGGCIAQAWKPETGRAPPPDRMPECGSHQSTAPAEPVTALKIAVDV